MKNSSVPPPSARLLSLLLIMTGLLLTAGRVNTSDLTAGTRTCADHLGKLPVAAGQELSPPLNVLSWNIQKTGNDGWLEDLVRLGGDRQLTFIQEAALHAGLGEIQPSGPLYQSFAQGYRSGDLSTGVMTLSTHAPAMQCNFTHTEPWLGTPKAATVTEHALAGSGERLLAINLHAVNFTFGVSDLEAQLRPLTELLASHSGPAILAGDFNTWSDTRHALVDQILAQQGLTALRFDPDRRTRAFGRPLDHIYVRGLTAEHTEVVPVSSSDHNALRARLKLTM